MHGCCVIAFSTVACKQARCLFVHSIMHPAYNPLCLQRQLCGSKCVALFMSPHPICAPAFESSTTPAPQDGPPSPPQSQARRPPAAPAAAAPPARGAAAARPLCMPAAWGRLRLRARPVCTPLARTTTHAFRQELQCGPGPYAGRLHTSTHVQMLRPEVGHLAGAPDSLAHVRSIIEKHMVGQLAGGHGNHAK